MEPKEEQPVKSEQEIAEEFVLKGAQKLGVPLQIATVITVALTDLLTNPEVIKIVAKAMLDIRKLNE
jgi:hypothetical protein